MDGEPGGPGPAAGGLRIPAVVLKILITVAVGTLTYVITNLIDRSPSELWQIALTVVIGGAALIVQYMVDFEQRLASVEAGQRQNRRDLQDTLAAHQRETTELVSQGFRRVSEVTDLFSRLDAAQMPDHDVSRLIRSTAQVGLQGRGFMQEFVREEIARLASMVTALTAENHDLDGENNDTLIALIKCARHTIDATSSFVDLAFWKTETAKQYLLVQGDAIRRGVEIKRLFIVKRPEEIPDDLDEILQAQKNEGIDAGVVVLSQLPRGTRVGPTRDIVIFDSELCFEITTDVEQLYPNAKLDAREDQVTRRKARFDSLWAERVQDPLQLRVR